MIQRNFVVFTASVFLFLIVFFTSSLIASQENPDKPSIKRSIQQSEISNPPPVKSNLSNPQSAIQNLSSTSTGDPQLDTTSFVQKTKKLKIPFIANNGQVDKQVKFYANTFGGTVFVTKDGEIVYALPDVETQCLASSMHSPKGIRDAVGMLQDDHVSDIMHPASWIVGRGSKSEFQNLSPTSTGDLKSGVAIKETLVGGRVQEITGNEKAVTKVSYFKGNDTSQWKTNISTYDVVSLGEVYDGIELKLKAYGDNVEKLFYVKPGASSEKIQVQLNGAKGLRINDEGQLVAETELGAVKFTKPVAYQEINGKRVDVRVEYRIQKSKLNPKSAIQNLSSTSTGDPKSKIVNRKSKYGFKVASYDKSHDLIIDPLLASTYLGGSKGDSGYSLTLDTSGNVYVTGSTSSTDFPTTSGAYDTSFNGDDDNVFVSKLDSGLTSLLASTYLGGTGGDSGRSITLDTSGNVYVTGSTSSTDFPTTSGVYDTSFNGVTEVFVSKLDSGLTSLLASTYLGGSDGDIGESLTLDTSGNVYVTGYTSSTDFPTTSGAYDTSFNGGSDVFVARLNDGLTSLLASTFLGGGTSSLGERYSTDYGKSIVVSSDRNIYITGYTYSTDFPTTIDAYDTSSNNYLNNYSSDAFVSELNESLTNLLASTSLGGYSDDVGYAITIDSGGNVYVTGETDSAEFPTSTGAYDTSYNGYNTDAFVSKLNESLTNLLASTYLGGSSSYDHGDSIAIDSDGNIYVAGQTYSSDFPTTAGAYYTSKRGSSDVFVSKLNGDLTSLLASTYLGGNSHDWARSIAIDSNGNVYVAGQAESSDFPTTKEAYDTSFNGDSDAFVSKFDSNLSGPPPSGSIDINNGNIYTNTTTVILNLSATDDLGVVGYYISTSSTTPSASDSGWTSITSTTNYTENISYTLSSDEGTKTVYVLYKDIFGNISNSYSDSIILDTTAPTVTITNPTSDDTYTVTSNVVAIGGSASDATSGISNVTWSNDNNGENGMAIGTTNWSISSIVLSSGDNIITITAKDKAGNISTDMITLIYNKSIIYGYVTNVRSELIESVKINLKGERTKFKNFTYSDADGFFEFADIETDNYKIIAKKKGYKIAKQTVVLGDVEEKEIEIMMKKANRKGRK